MDETYVQVKGQCAYLYRAVDRDGRTLDFMLSAKRDKAAAHRFFKRAISTNGTPARVAIDKSGANLAGLWAVHGIRKFMGSGRLIRIMQSKYLNNMVEQDHRFIKRITRQHLASKRFTQQLQRWLGSKPRTWSVRVKSPRMGKWASSTSPPSQHECVR